MAERRQVFKDHFDSFRSTVVNEPRGNDVMVGALLCEPVNPSNAAGVIFFNNVDCLYMCGHGLIGLLVTMAHMGRIKEGVHTIETPVGEVVATLHDNHTVSLRNVPSYRYRKGVEIDVAGLGRMIGDIAWGGNWFFLVNQHNLNIHLSNVDELTQASWNIRQALQKMGITGAEGALIDHVELFGPPSKSNADSKNFVLCPGKAYDRSPCGTGTSAKVSCLAADGKLKPGQILRQASILDSIFEASYEMNGKDLLPTIKGSAYITAEVQLISQPEDPFFNGISHECS
jgi:4-hydroxyproline epimerase